MENNKSEPSSQRSKNLIFIGATGAGKSSTCNTLLGSADRPFPVGHDELSCTSKILIKVNKEKKIRLIDTPDYRDNRYEWDKIDDVREAVAAVFDKNATDHTKQVDAFVLVVKMNPRISTLRDDLKHIKHLFGTDALRSVLLLVINHGSAILPQDFLENLKQMEPVKKVLVKAKGERPNENWFCYWDNINPIPGQEEQLMAKIGKLKPYTYEKFLEGKKEASLRRSMIAETEMETELERIRNSYISEGAMMTRKLNELDETIKKEKEELIQARDRALENVNQVMEAVRLLDERASKGIEELYGIIAKEREETVKRCMEIIRVREKGHGTNIDAFLKENREILERFKRHVGQRRRELEKEAEEENGEKKNMLRERALKEAEKLVKKRAGKIAAKTAEELAKFGAQEILKTGLKKVVKKIVCNIF